MLRGLKTMEKTKVFISQPMRELPPEYLKAVRGAEAADIRQRFGDSVEIIDSLFDYGDGKPPAYYLGKAIQLLSGADCAYFCPGWDNYRGCTIEHRVCMAYGIEIIRD